jgi:hypothetical protein
MSSSDRFSRQVHVLLTQPVRLLFLAVAVVIAIVVALSASLRGAASSELRLVSSTTAMVIARITTSLIRDASAQIDVPRRAGLGFRATRSSRSFSSYRSASASIRSSRLAARHTSRAAPVTATAFCSSMDRPTTSLRPRSASSWVNPEQDCSSDLGGSRIRPGQLGMPGSRRVCATAPATIG